MKLQNEQAHSLYSSPNIVRVINPEDWGGRVFSQNGRRYEWFIILGDEPKGRKTLGRPWKK